jgi:hypothetical protein
MLNCHDANESRRLYLLKESLKLDGAEDVYSVFVYNKGTRELALGVTGILGLALVYSVVVRLQYPYWYYC